MAHPIGSEAQYRFSINLRMQGIIQMPEKLSIVSLVEYLTLLPRNSSGLWEKKIPQADGLLAPLQEGWNPVQCEVQQADKGQPVNQDGVVHSMLLQ